MKLDVCPTLYNSMAVSNYSILPFLLKTLYVDKTVLFIPATDKYASFIHATSKSATYFYYYMYLHSAKDRQLFLTTPFFLHVVLIFPRLLVGKLEHPTSP